MGDEGVLIGASMRNPLQRAAPNACHERFDLRTGFPLSVMIAFLFLDDREAGRENNTKNKIK
jgi:hypothetical protein